MNTMLSSAILLVLIAFACSQPASAQDFLTSPGYSALIHNTLTNSVVNNNLRRGGRSSTASSRSTSGERSSRAEVPAYRRYPAVQFKSTGTYLTLKEYLDTVQVGQKEKEEVRQLVISIWQNYEKEASGKGYPNDLALALVSCAGLNSRVYNGVTGTPSIPFEQNLGMRDTIAEYAADNGTFDRLTDREKQELYELFVMLGGLTYHYYEKAVKANNADEIKEMRLFAKQNLRRLGIEP